MPSAIETTALASARASGQVLAASLLRSCQRRTANYTASNGEIAPTLGRNLAACRGAAVCASTATVPLIVPQTMFDDRLSRLDLRLAKRFVLSDKVRLQANFNIYNLFNGSASSVLNTNFGSLWLQPSLLQDGRMVQFSASLTF